MFRCSVPLFHQGHILLLHIITLYSFLSKLMSQCAIDKREEIEEENKRSFVLSSLSEQAGRVQYKGALFIDHSDKLLLFQTPKKNQYCGNVAPCPFTLPPFYPSFLSQFGEFCSHSLSSIATLPPRHTPTHTHTPWQEYASLTNKLDSSF